MFTNPEVAQADRELCRARADLGEAIARRALEAAETAGDLAVVAEASLVLGECLFEQSRLEEARVAIERAFTTASRVFGPDHLATTHARSCLATLFWSLDQGAEARALSARAKGAVPADPAPEDRLIVVRILKNLAIMEQRLSRVPEALALLHRALALLSAEGPQVELEIASVSVIIGMTEEVGKRHLASRKHYERALGIRRRLLGEPHIYVAYCLHHLAQVHLQLKEMIEAKALLIKAIAMMRRAGGDDHVNVGTMLVTMATISLLEGDEPLALEQYEEAVEIQAKSYGAEHPNLAIIRIYIGIVHDANQRFTLGEPHLRRALASLVPHGATRLETLLMALNNLLLCLRGQKKFQEILDLCEPLLERWERTPDVAPELLAALWNGASEAAFLLRRRGQAERFLKLALRTAEARFGRDAPELDPLLANLAQVYRTISRKGDANQLERRRAALKPKDN